jgi:hypothetical protein
MRAGLAPALVAVALACGVPPAAAQEFQPPSSGGYTGTSGFDVDIFGFSTRGGIDVTRPTEWVVGTTVDVAEMWSPRVRLRPSLEVSSDGSVTRLHWSGEVVYRFEPDAAPAIPYVGVGLGHMTHCAGCVTLWPTIVMGFELRFRPAFNWLIEYHALDRLGRHRFLVGLSTRDAGVP